MNILLTSDLEDLINQKLESGQYNSPSEVVREGLLLLKAQDQLKELRRDELRREVMKGVEDIKQGRYRTYNSGEELAAEIIREGLKEITQRNENP